MSKNPYLHENKSHYLFIGFFMIKRRGEIRSDENLQFFNIHSNCYGLFVV